MKRRKPLSFFLGERTRPIRAGVLAVGLLAGASAFAACDVRAVPMDSIAWQTLHAASVTLPVDYPDGAVRATVTATDMEGRQTVIDVPSGANATVWTPFTGTAPAEDNVYDLTLAFYKENADSAFTNYTARVAVVKGAFGDAIDAKSASFASAWAASPRAPVFAYSPAWATDVAADTSVTTLVLTASTAAGPILALTNAATDVSSERWFAARLPGPAGTLVTVSLSTLPGAEGLPIEWMSADLRIGQIGTVFIFR